MAKRDMLKAPMIQWERLFERMDFQAKQEAADRAAHLATQSARLSAYISRRLSGGKHTDAVKRQNQTARKVRQALGYTYADDAVTF